MVSLKPLFASIVLFFQTFFILPAILTIVLALAIHYYPDNIKSAEKILPLNVPYESKSNLLYKEGTPKNIPFKSNKPKPTTVSQEDAPQRVTDLYESRNNDRILVGQRLAELVQEYYVKHGLNPVLYTNKSNSELDEDGSSVVYLYNDSQNKTNASALNIGANSYLFKKVDLCIEPEEQDLYFVYDEEYITVCFEEGESRAFWIGI